MNIGELCSREVYCVRPEEPLAEAAREMRKRHVGALVVVEPKGDSLMPVGIVTDRDIVCGQLTHAADLFCLTVADVMSRDPLTLAERSGLAEGIAALSAKGVRRAPVVNDARELVGLVSIDDLLPVIAGKLSSLAELIGHSAAK